MPKQFKITLSSFLRRVIKAYALKAEMRAIGCTLQRKGRSRHWILSATFEQLEQVVNYIRTTEEPSWQWVAKHITEQKNNLTHQELLNIARKQPGISINQLMAKTDCTIAEARTVIDELEEF
ncbi:ribosome recycling factor family protein [Pseudocolwellia agarivorans]|uniref:ribosome recycling factor family protein n=1 Tax=Pseudocolwellia agarivorans TaxID=1911682 RepID=UPI000985A9EB|nr:ribosome recycling factor family protein [Pseudocolwellia agarivorans]